MPLFPLSMGCKYGWVSYVGHGVAVRAPALAATTLFAAAVDHGVAGRAPALEVVDSAAAAVGHGVAGGGQLSGGSRYPCCSCVCAGIRGGNSSSSCSCSKSWGNDLRESRLFYKCTFTIWCGAGKSRFFCKCIFTIWCGASSSLGLRPHCRLHTCIGHLASIQIHKGLQFRFR